MAPTLIEKAESKRDRLKLNIVSAEDKLKSHATVPLTYGKVLQWLASIEPLRVKLDENFEEISLNADKADLPAHHAEFANLYERLTDVHGGFDDLKRELAPANPPPPPPPIQMKLPHLQLPKFNGDLKEWTSFRDLFTTAIHANVSLSDAQKLTFLKTSLSGEAARLIASLAVTDANYSIAWAQLNDRYQNERELLYSILGRFFSQPKVQSNSSTAIRSLIDVTKECIRSLEVLGRPVGSWGDVILFTMFQRLDQTSRELWEQSLKSSGIPALKDLMDFLESRSRALAAGSSSGNLQEDKQTCGKGPGRTGRQTQSAHHLQTSSTNSCKVCSQGNHPLYQCPQFRKLSVSERYEVVKKGSHCFICLSGDHFSSNCSSSRTCRKCNGKHNSMLHVDKVENRTLGTAPGDANSTPSSVITCHTRDDKSIKQNLLATAIVQLKDVNGQLMMFRALLDGGSTCSFIADSCVQKLGLTRRRSCTEVLGLASTSLGSTKGMVSVKLSPHFDNNLKIDVNLLILPKVTGVLPSFPCDPTDWPHLQDLVLADPRYFQPSNVDLLLGADVFWNILLDGKKTGENGSPVGVRTELGWLVAGQLNSASNKILAHHADVNLEKLVQRLWEVESLSSVRSMTKEEQACEDHFITTHHWDETGRYVVALPYKNPKPPLGNSRDLCVRRLKQIERRLAKDPVKQQQYIEFMNEYESMGHMELVPASERDSPIHPTNYISHHYVQSSSKFRVVFDASMESDSGVSFNQTLMVGPTLQDGLTDILTRFRRYPVAFTADVGKMYRQIRVTDADADMQRILWRESPDQQIKEYRLRTVTYGTASAPYLATKVLQTMAREAKATEPLGAQVLEDDMYVDDGMSSTPTVPLAIQTVKEMISITDQVKMPLLKWASNSPELLDTLPPEKIARNPALKFDSDQTVKALGIHWNTTTDCFEFKVTISMNTPSDGYTKRTLLGEVAKTFDPLGWLAPAIITAKILIQSLWKLQMGWDSKLPEEIQQHWISYRNNLPLIEKICISRCLIPPNCTHLNLIGFCDASERAYAAVVYTVAYLDRGEPVISLISSKTRVAPVKQVSLPRLELCGAVLLANLMETVQRALKVSFNEIMAFTDSTVVLAWIQAHPSKWKTFVANRVTEIQNSFPPSIWKHVKGTENPADCASRGLDPSELQHHPLWWKGPDWLKTGSMDLPPQELDKDDLRAANLEEKPEPIKVHHVFTDESIIHRFSKYDDLIRYTAYLLRFVHNCLVRVQVKKCEYPLNQILTGFLTARELDKAMMTWIRVAQGQAFAEEIHMLASGKELSPRSRVLPLCPFLDSSGILRVGGRLRNAAIPKEQKTPILLPKHHQFTKMLIVSEHLKHLHGGANLLQAVLNRRFWIVGARDAIKLQIKKCVTCVRHSAHMQQQLMGDLPAARVIPSRPFQRTGIDYAGPFALKPIAPRSKVTVKGYLAIFVCFVTRAIHLEVVSSLSTEAFLGSLRRMISRRGKPSEIFSDCGTNFVGANSEIKEMVNLINSIPHNNKMSKEMAKIGIEWHFNSPGAPHMGGLWEAGVKSVKHHLYRAMGSTRLTFEEMTTVMSQIEACLNSRPLMPASSDSNDLEALTPGHFLIGAPLTSLPDPDLLDVPMTHLSRWQLVQRVTQQVQKRWKNEFLARLQQRPKWHKKHDNIKINSLVLIKNELCPPLKWPLARVLQIHPGPDGLVRVVTLKTATGELKRPIAKLCLLPIDPDDQE